MQSRLWTFDGGEQGAFRIASVRTLRGDPLPDAERLEVTLGTTSPAAAAFRLRGVVSHDRYVTAGEKVNLVAHQQAIGRADAILGALIPIRKNAHWWALPQDERRAIFEERSGHIQIGLRALPGVARRLHHSRDLGTPEPFDFLTWFDFRPEDTSRFDDLLGALRETEEWTYVDREVELRVER